METTSSLKYRSSRNLPADTSFRRSRLLAAMIRTSTCRGAVVPIRCTAPSWRTRNNLPCTSSVSSAISSRNSVLPSALSNIPL